MKSQKRKVPGVARASRAKRPAGAAAAKPAAGPAERATAQAPTAGPRRAPAKPQGKGAEPVGRKTPTLPVVRPTTKKTGAKPVTPRAPRARPPATRRGTAVAVAAAPAATPTAVAGTPGAEASAARASGSPASAGAPGRKSSAPAARPAFRVPPILFEGDPSPGESVSGPGARFALGPGAAVAGAGGGSPAGLPETYGTERLWVAARDPHWLYAHWDLTASQLERYESLSGGGQLALRVHVGALGRTPLLEVTLARGAHSWFVHVGRGDTFFVAELGYFDRSGNWQAMAHSEAVRTPPEAASAEAGVEFTTIPVDVPFAVIRAMVEEAAREHEPLARVLSMLQAEGFAGLPGPAEIPVPAWTPAQERALAEVMRVDPARRVWVSSLDVTELVTQRLGAAAAASAPAGPGGEHPTSPARAYVPTEAGGVSSPGGPSGEGERKRGFWFNVNAELVVYGATEPDAILTIGGRVVKLRPDGGFSLRFALPDGQYELPIVALARAGDDGRSADLQFGRRTEYGGVVGVHAQDAQLRPPQVEHLTPESTLA